MRNETTRTVLGIITTIALSVVIILEFRIGFNMVKTRQFSEVNEFINTATKVGRDSVSVSSVTVYDEVPDVAVEGSVVKLKGFDVKLKLNGELSDETDEEMGSYVYMSADTNEMKTLSVMKIESGVTDCRNAVKHFWYGNAEELGQVAFDGTAPNDVQYYQCTYRGGNIPVVYSETEGVYNMIIPGENEFYLLISAPEQFVVTYEKVTSQFGDPNASPQNFHTYSKYEEWASSAKLLELKEQEENGKEKDKETPYKTSDVPGTSATYTSKADDSLREQMSTIGEFSWKKDGTSSDTELSVDITSEDAKKSKWTLTETTYSYENSGLKIYALSGSRSAEVFTIEGTIQNMLNSERPYIIIVKYLDTNDELLGVSVIDKRSTPIKPEGVDKFSTTVTPASDKIDIQRIASLMFEAY